MQIALRVVFPDEAVGSAVKAIATSAQIVLTSTSAVVTSAQAVVTFTCAEVRNDEVVVTNGEVVLTNGKAPAKISPEFASDDFLKVLLRKDYPRSPEFCSCPPYCLPAQLRSQL